MYVCVCKGITDRQILQALDNGAQSFRDVRDQLGAATQCGSCAPMTRELVEEHRNAITNKCFYSAA